jgi:hypothetical protein
MTEHVCSVRAYVVVRVNDGPPTSPIEVHVSDGDTLTIMQPVEATFAASGAPSRKVRRSTPHANPGPTQSTYNTKG